MTDLEPVLEIDGLTVDYPAPRRRVAPLRALDAVSLTVGRGETVAVVGESGSGKSTLGKAILGLVGITGGSIRFGGRDITSPSVRERRLLASEMQVVFQDPFSSLNPARTIRDSLLEALHTSTLAKDEAESRLETTLERVGLSRDIAARYPSQFSGGQRQRIAVARALMARPRLVICDEAVSALDLSVQAQVLNLLRELQEDLGVSYLFISHDLSVVRSIAQRTVVLYRGRVVEHGPTRKVCDAPEHPYTRALVSAVPIPDPRIQRQRRQGGTLAASLSDKLASSDGPPVPTAL